ncbi:MAG: hypothetical protein ACKOBP_11045 [Planctomycetia bacterium]
MATIPQIRTRLLEVFSEKQADVLAHVVIEAHDDLVTQADFHKLTGVVADLANAVTDLAESQKELADAQKRTEIRVEELADAQKRTEVHVEELAEAQKRTEIRVEELAEAQKRTEVRVEELADAQKRTEQRVGELADAQKGTEIAVADLARQVGGLSNALGGSLEDFACDLVPEILEKHWRLAVASAQPEEIETSRGPYEVDLVVRGTIDHRPVIVVCEVKTAVSATEVTRFMRIVESLRAARPDEDIRALFFGYRADRKARDEIVQAGAAMVFTRGVMIPAA